EGLEAEALVERRVDVGERAPVELDELGPANESEPPHLLLDAELPRELLQRLAASAQGTGDDERRPVAVAGEFGERLEYDVAVVARVVGGQVEEVALVRAAAG